MSTALQCLHEKDWGAMEEWKKDTTTKLDAILAQSIKTNGRVRALERWRLVLMSSLATLLVTQGKDLVTMIQLLWGHLT